MSEGAASGGANTPDAKIISELFRSHWRIEDDVNSARMKHMQSVGKLRELQADVRTRVKDAGLSLRVFKEMVAQEADRRRVANRLAKLEDDDTALLDVMKDKLGHLFGTPMGDAAMKAAEEKKTARASRTAARNADLDDMGSKGSAESNVTRLERGIGKTIN